MRRKRRRRRLAHILLCRGEMKNNFLSLLLAVGICAIGLLAVPSARATVTISYNDTVTAINGTRNPDGFWNSYLDTGLNLQLSLKAQTTIIGNSPSPNDGAGTFIFPVGNKPGSAKATWGNWFSINTNPSGFGINHLDAYDFYLTYDTPAAPGTFINLVNVLTAFGDNAYGNNSTLNGQGTIGTTATSPTLVLNNNIAQNAENISFFGLPTTLLGNYDFQLYAVASGAGSNGLRLAEADMLVNVVPVPEPETFTLACLGTLILRVLRLRRKSDAKVCLRPNPTCSR
jgi:hypothetical protein